MIAGIIGASGYAGAELVRLLASHSDVDELVPASVSRSGERIDEAYPNFLRAGEDSGCNPVSARLRRVLEKPEDVIARSDIVFGALPAGAGEGYAKACLDRGISYIDLGADFRFEDEETYRAWYGKAWEYPELRRRAVYGLPELNRRRIRELALSGPVIIGNPGCYPTAVTLAALPALSLVSGTIVADAISGVTGAGREPGRAYHFPECSGSVSPYKVGSHRHGPEISRNLFQGAGRTVPLVFTPHLGPYNRGILATVYLPLKEGEAKAAAGKTDAGAVSEKTAAFREQYRSFYREEPFVRVLPEGLCAATNRVRQSNYCDLSVHLASPGQTGETGTMLIVAAAIDNMVKGAAGQAVQNMNIILGFEETVGLTSLPALF
ncbi:MAG: N-acetyl-gamma-glutamyl-phosphate reductase [Treponema sp.]|jgi:N-acetyl-gamma-glutamyl-phosphate reductase|nr:N-acetyl-gamma-glutamyl-phosphate reductase [Treponema sp.]